MSVALEVCALCTSECSDVIFLALNVVPNVYM